MPGKITLMSFGFKYGLPNANYYFDVGFLKNPARQTGWNFFSTPDSMMKEYVLEQDKAKEFISFVLPLLRFLLTVDQHQVCAFGCNAGRHRSSIIVEYLAKLLREGGTAVETKHRECSLG